MRIYIYYVICIAAISGIVLMIAPEGVRSGIKKHIKLICSLCLLCVMINPISELLGAIENIGDIENDLGGPKNELESMYESIYEGNVESNYIGSIGISVKEKLLDEFSISQNECRVEVSFYDADGDGLREPERITVILSGRSVFQDPRKIEAYIEKLYNCKCVCAIE